MKNRYGVDGAYFNKKLTVIIRDMEFYKPSELAREFNILINAIRPMDECVKCKKNTLIVYDENRNKCLACKNIQQVKGA